jgi:hypothetical protein
MAPIKIRSIRPGKAQALLGDIVVDALVFEFMGLAVLGLCVIVVAVPSGRDPSRRARHH